MRAAGTIPVPSPELDHHLGENVLVSRAIGELSRPLGRQDLNAFGRIGLDGGHVGHSGWELDAALQSNSASRANPAISSARGARLSLIDILSDRKTARAGIRVRRNARSKTT